MSLRRVLLILVACALGLAVIPFRSLNCPEWDVWVVDQNGQPVSGITVRLSYKNYSAEDETHEIDRTTDQRGHTAFAAQTLSASLVRRLIFILSSLRAGKSMLVSADMRVCSPLGRDLKDSTSICRETLSWSGLANPGIRNRGLLSNLKGLNY